MKLFQQTIGSGPPLLIIHGLLGASGNWQTLARKQFSTYFTTIAVDLRNHGKSPHAASISYPEMAQDLLELLAEEGISKTHVLGHSMGGKLAMHLALNFPDHVDKIIVADIAPRAYPRSHDVIFNALKAIDFSTITSRSEVEEALSPAIPDLGVRQFLTKNLVRTESGMEWGMNLSAIEHHYEGLIGEINAWEPFLGEALFIRGSKSSYVLDSDTDAIRALFPLARVETIIGSGHWLHAEAPDTFANICLKFLR